MIIVVKIVSDAGLRVGQVGKNGPLAEFKHLCFESGPEAFRRLVVVAVTAPALRAHRPVLMQKGAVSVAAILATLPGTTPVRVDEEAWGGRLRQKSALQGRSDEFFEDRDPHVPADHVLGAQVMKGV